MPFKSDSSRWGSIAKTFHWLVVVLILVQATVGLVMVQLPKRPNVIPLFDFHKSLGLTILALAVLRLAWRAFDRRPSPPPAMPRWQVIGARAGHVALYGLLFAVPLSGWWFDSASSLRPLYWWGVVHVPHLTAGPDKALATFTAGLHETLFWTLAAVAAGHAIAALWHHFVTGDIVLVRMLPSRARSHDGPG